MNLAWPLCTPIKFRPKSEKITTGKSSSFVKFRPKSEKKITTGKSSSFIKFRAKSKKKSQRVSPGVSPNFDRKVKKSQGVSPAV